MKLFILTTIVVFYSIITVFSQTYYKKGYIAVDSTSGRGKYLIISLKKEQPCSAIYIEEPTDNFRLIEYQIERLDGLKWRVVTRCKRENSKEFITFSPQMAKKIRIHFLRAEKMPNISKLIIYIKAEN